MANLTKAMNDNLIDLVLPEYGKSRINLPRWDEAQKMFICEDHESEAGHYYYAGVRFCNRIVIVERNGRYHNWTYLDGLELYAFDGTKLKLVQQRKYEKVFHNQEFIREESTSMVSDYLKGMLKMQGSEAKPEQLEEQANSLVGDCYKSFLASDFNMRLTNIIPQIEK